MPEPAKKEKIKCACGHKHSQAWIDRHGPHAEKWKDQKEPAGDGDDKQE